MFVISVKIKIVVRCNHDSLLKIILNHSKQLVLFVITVIFIVGLYCVTTKVPDA